MTNPHTKLTDEETRLLKNAAHEGVFLAYALGLVFLLVSGYSLYNALFGAPEHRWGSGYQAVVALIALLVCPRVLLRDARKLRSHL